MENRQSSSKQLTRCVDTALVAHPSSPEYLDAMRTIRALSAELSDQFAQVVSDCGFTDQQDSVLLCSQYDCRADFLQHHPEWIRLNDLNNAHLWIGPEGPYRFDRESVPGPDEEELVQVQIPRVGKPDPDEPNASDALKEYGYDGFIQQFDNLSALKHGGELERTNLLAAQFKKRLLSVPFAERADLLVPHEQELYDELLESRSAMLLSMYPELRDRGFSHLEVTQ